MSLSIARMTTIIDHRLFKIDWTNTYYLSYFYSYIISITSTVKESNEIDSIKIVKQLEGHILPGLP